MENSRLFAPVAELHAVGKLYTLASGEMPDRHGAPARAAWEIERLAVLRGWPAGETLGSEALLRKKLRVSRETLREAIRIVESRGAMRMRRGRCGGLMLVQPTIERTAASLAAYLRAAGFTAEQFDQSVRGLDQLLAWELARKQGPLPPPEPHESVRHWLARASGRHTYLVYISVLDRLAPRTATVETPPPALERTIGLHDAGAIQRLLATLPFAPACDNAGVTESGTSAQAATIAVKMIERANARANAHLGNEASLCEEFDTSRSLVRQALRILQDLDLIGVRLGRGGGYTLKQPSPIGVVRQVFAWLAARNCCPLALNELMWDLNAANLRLAGERLGALPQAARERHCAEFDRIVGELRGQERFMRLQQALSEVAACPVIATLARCVVAYQARSYGDFPEQVPSPVFDRLESTVAIALRAGDIDLAERALRTLQRRAYRRRLQTYGFALTAE